MGVNKESTKEEDALYKAFSPIVNRLIDENFTTSKDKIASQMAPLIGSAIREQIKSHKDDVIDALYPVLGNMISRYVSKTLEETLNTINQQIQNGLSFKALRRKIRAKVQGISETELLLNESSSSNIRALLFIHKETGTVLAQANNPNAPLVEPEMVASMMSAIQSFVNDWISKNDTHSELAEIEYGGNKIILENSGYSYLAVIVDGAVFAKTYDDIRKTLETIVSAHGKEIKEFNSDLRDFPNIDIYKKISSLLSNSEDVKHKEKKLHPLMYMIPLLFIAFLFYSFYENYIDRSISNEIREKIAQNSQLAPYKIDVKTEDKVTVLTGIVPLEYHSKLAETLLVDVENIKNIQNSLKVLSNADPLQMSSNIAYLINGLNTHEGINLHYTFDYPHLKVSGEVWDSKRKELVSQKIKSLQEFKKTTLSISVVPPDIKETIYFKKGSFKLSKKERVKLNKLAKKLVLLDSKTSLDLQGYGDESGTFAANKHVIDMRVKNVSEILHSKEAVLQSINATSNYSSPDDVNASLSPDEARCVIITIQK